MSAPAALKAGDLVYRVVEVDPPDDAVHTWAVASVEIERASARQIKLKKAFHGLDRRLFPPVSYGRSFFETPLQAIQTFLTNMRNEVESLERRRKEADRAIAWVTSQEGVTP